LTRSKLLSAVEATGAVVIWGASFVATKYALRFASPDVVVWLRFALGVVVLGAAVWLRRQFVPVNRKDTAYFILVGFIGIALHQWLQSNGMVTSQATTTAWIVASIPAVSALIGWLALKERLTVIQLMGVLVAAVGVLVVITRGDLRQLAQGRFGAPGDFLILLSSPNWAIFSVLSRYGLRKYPATLMMFYVMLWGWLLYLPLFLASDGLQALPRLALPAWGTLAFLGFFSSGLAYIFWYDALQVFSAGQTNTFVYLEPLVTVIVAALWLNEKPGWAVGLGGCLILAGVWLVNHRDLLTGRNYGKKGTFV